ncbi:1-acyl-sn-glycerol-3-phosphate acyltransferase [Tepidibacillus sp. HK-1]|uniref:lysophospholipid acyltransferase family protein n=1 Tax=Tepidibacillus sp. HK-1 TaxID=1883407 RepID=UPI000853D282|nr:glycerol acyltransferase [Tepidibacillus sp. HK-1]
MKNRHYGILFRIIRGFIRIFYPRYKVLVPDRINGPVVYISHHQNLFGPFVTLLWFPKCLHAWILHVFLDQAACYKQYVDYTFTKRFGWNRNLAKMVAFPLSFFISKLLNSGKGIPVYRGSRKILETFHQSVEVLKSGQRIVIFPDIDYRDPSSEVKEMYKGFLYLEKYFFQEIGEHLTFVPLYVSKNKRLILANRQIYFRDGEGFNEERKRIVQEIHTNLNELAKRCGDLT